MALSLIDELKKAANLKPTKRTVVLTNGKEVEFYCAPLTMAEREKAQAQSKNPDDTNTLALQLLVNKAQTKTGERMFNASHIAELKHFCKEQDVQALMLAVISDAEAEEEPTDMKRTRKATTEG
jgi:hypothetical protein|tara:strand:- start:132 stop:503 length:372 start_codon:yes stop_codon:yes gene_type:complete